MCVSSHDNHLNKDGFRSTDCILCILFGAYYSSKMYVYVQTHTPQLLMPATSSMFTLFGASRVVICRGILKHGCVCWPPRGCHDTGFLSRILHCGEMVKVLLLFPVSGFKVIG